MKRYPPYASEEQRVMMFETLLEQWHNNITLDYDRVETEVVDPITDVITEMFMDAREKLSKSPTIEENSLIKMQFGASLYTLLNLQLEDLAEADVNKEMEL